MKSYSVDQHMSFELRVIQKLLSTTIVWALELNEMKKDMKTYKFITVDR